MVELDLKERKMNISKYDFHDGYVIDLKHINNKIKISMESAEISDEELKDDIILSDHSTIKGKLHMERIKNIRINNKDYLENFLKIHDKGNIYSFDRQKPLRYKSFYCM